MKKLMTIFCITCLSVSAIAQSGVRIGSYQVIVKKANSDTINQIILSEPCLPCPSENNNQPKPKPKFIPYQTTRFFAGACAILPESDEKYYTVLGGKSFSVDAGWHHSKLITRWLAFGGTLQYSFYNYKLRDAASEPKFAEEVIGMDFAKDDIRRQAFRSHNVAVGAFTRLYLVPIQTRAGKHTSNSGRMFIDLGAQGDFAPFKFYLLDTHSEGKKKYYDDYTFNAFNASAFGRVGFGSWAVIARYRFTDVFNKKVLPMDLPPISIGIQFF